jgi:UDP-glucose:(galactosyl)LPS alpha-1,2-glucosyltransferase
LEYKEQLLKAIVKKNTFNGAERQYNGREIHIGYGVDDAYTRCMGTSIASICKNNKEEHLIFHILTGRLREENLQKIKQLAEDFSVEVNLYFLDESAFQGLPTQVHFPLSIYYRYILPIILDVPRVLYIDADIVCLGSLDKLWALDLEGNIIGAVADVEWMGVKRNRALNLHNHQYFNSGVLLIDIIKWNQINTLDKVIQALAKEPEKFRYPDQDALNLILIGKVFYLNDCWNHLNTIKEWQEDSILLHFAAHPKPWNIAWTLSDHCNAFTKDIYRAYEQLTPWRNEPLLLPKNYKEMKNYARCLFKNGQTLDGIGWYIKYVKNKVFIK